MSSTTAVSQLPKIDDCAQQQLKILGAKSAFSKIKLPVRLWYLLLWILFTVTGILLPLTLGVGLFVLGILNYIILLSFRINNNVVNLKKNDNVVELERTDLPTFSILFPLKQENEVIYETIYAIDALDYPKSLVQVIIVVEQTDVLTQSSLQQIDLPKHFEVLYIQELPPYTKGRALLHALEVARGEFVTVYDAESRPEPQQLRKAAAILQSSSIDICCQAKIQISNLQLNWLTRNFAGEYYEWYEQHLYELSSTGLPFGLGGNSFFIAKKALVNAGAWDPFNVTEDADLSVRLVQQGIQLRILDSYTSETCPESINNWINQRTRWNKGLFITQLVHLRKSLFTNGFGLRGWLSFWLRMICAALLPFYNLYIALYMLLAVLPYTFSIAFSAVLWSLLAVNLLTSWIINVTTYRKLGIKQSIIATFWDAFRYLFLHIIAGFKSYWEYFKAPLQWNKTEHT